jgi:hypothetical protein
VAVFLGEAVTARKVVGVGLAVGEHLSSRREARLTKGGREVKVVRALHLVRTKEVTMKPTAQYVSSGSSVRSL